VHKTLTIHGVFLKIGEWGVLLEGPPGMGKSDIALQLISRGAKLIADDAPAFYSTGKNIMGFCPPPIQNKLEIRGLGIADIPNLFGNNAIQTECSLNLIIQLTDNLTEEKKRERRLEPKLVEKTILDIPIKHLTLPIIFTSNVAILVEVAVKWVL